MSREIERKFLLATEPPEAAEVTARSIEQGYLAVSDRAEVRLRRAGSQLTLGVKLGHGEEREEIEVELYLEQFERLWPLTEGARLAKTRRTVVLAEGLAAEVDTYNGRLEGLAVIEVEFGSEDQAGAFEPPPWFGAEVTGEDAYANQTLASLEGPPPTGVEVENELVSSAYRLKHKESPAAGVRRVALGRAQRSQARLSEAEPGAAAQAVHGARKDLKKLRAVLRLVREGIGEKAYRAENRRYRDAGRLLSESRDAEVKLETLEGLRERFGDALPPSQVGAWRAALEADRARMETGVEGRRVSEAIAAIGAGEVMISGWKLRPNSWKLLEPGLDRSYRRGREALRSVHAGAGEDSVHELRKRVKDLWYQQRLLAEAWPEMLEAGAEQAHRMADLLGDHHDLSVLAEDLRSRAGLSTNRRASEELIAIRQAELLEDALALGDRLYAEKPKCFRRRMHGYWRAWRD